MKHAAIILAIVVAAFVVGCQDNNITNPIAGPISAGMQISTAHSAGTIPLNTVVREPYGFNAFTEISGQVTYTTEIVPRDPIPPHPQWALVVTLTTDAVAKPFGLEEPVWRIVGSSRDELALTEDGDGTMVCEKSYALVGRNDRVSLHLQFHCTRQTVVLSRMWLAFSADGRHEDDN